MQVLALDPSILHLGWATLNSLGALSFGTIKAPAEMKEGSLVERIAWMLKELNDVNLCGVHRIVIEQPEPWGAYKSLASSRSGSLLMLQMLTGAIVGWALSQTYSISDQEVVLVKVSQWKGQLPKNVTKMRMERKYNCKFATTDEADAVGLADWYLQQGEKNV